MVKAQWPQSPCLGPGRGQDQEPRIAAISWAFAVCWLLWAHLECWGHESPLPRGIVKDAWREGLLGDHCRKLKTSPLEPQGHSKLGRLMPEKS